MTTRLADLALILKRLAEAYGQTIPAERAKRYHQVLKTYPRLVLVQCADDELRRRKFFPTVAELAQAAEARNRQYVLPPGHAFDEAAFWLMYRRGYESTDEIQEADLVEIYKDTGMEHDYDEEAGA